MRRPWLPLTALLLVPAIAQADKVPSRPPESSSSAAPPVASTPSTAATTAATTAASPAPRAGGCSLLTSAEPALGVGMVLLGLLALGERRRARA